MVFYNHYLYLLLYFKKKSQQNAYFCLRFLLSLLKIYCCLLENCTQQCILPLSASAVNLLHSLRRFAYPTATPVKRCDADVSCLSLPLAICFKQYIGIVKLTHNKSWNRDYHIRVSSS